MNLTEARAEVDRTWRAFEEADADAVKAHERWVSVASMPNPNPEWVAKLESEWRAYKAGVNATYAEYDAAVERWEKMSAS